MEEQLIKFLDDIKSLRESGRDTIATEYKAIRSQTDVMRRDFGLTTEAGALSDNVKKNRYRDILPYDQSRVVLVDGYGSDYINANFIQGAVKDRLYIATQGPLSNTVTDFWRMVWQYAVKVIIMACKETETGKKKCERYWPAYPQTNTFGSFIVSNLNESEPNEEIVVRSLSVKYQDETRCLSQFQYTAWPDHGIPCTSDSILDMLNMVHEVQVNSTTPVLIHCSAGCGRTGVICAVDYINDLLRTKSISQDFQIMDIVLQMRTQRPSAVQTKEQYEFLYYIVQQMFEKALLYSANNDQNWTATHQPEYGNVALVKNKGQQAASLKTSKPATKRQPKTKPRISNPGAENMNDTYAVVNKQKQQPATGAARSSQAFHHYDNAQSEDPNRAAMALYSTVKPKTQAGGKAPQHDRTSKAVLGNKTSALSEDQGGYEIVSGVIRTQSSKPTSVDSNKEPSTARRHSSGHSLADDDYEYVTPPDITTTVGQDGGMGFNCRLKKPKGPRDPPSHWSRDER